MDMQQRDDRLTCRTVPPARPVPGIADDARAGLLVRPRSLPPKYFYDERGSVLFERICETPEYYPSRCESALLQQHAAAIADAAQPAHIVELGSGSSRKTRHLLDACTALAPAYWPFDVAESMLVDSGHGLIRDYPWLRVHALVGDYLGGLDNLPLPSGGARLFVFLGGTIGNFEAAEADRFMAELVALMTPEDRLLLGVDRVKDKAVLTAAYNDRSGVTAAFNLNVLRVLNRELDADFDETRFVHEALYRPDPGRIEMHLLAREPHAVDLAALGERIGFEDGESILTEISRKFTRADLGELLARTGLVEATHFEAPGGYYSLVLARLGGE